MADYVVNAVFQDNISQGAQAATDALNNAATAADTVTTAVTKTTASAAALAAKYDPLTQSTNALTRAQQQFAAAQASVAAGVAAGKISQDQANGTLDTLQQKVLAAQKAVDALSPSVNTATTSTGNMSFAMRQLEVQAEQAIAGIATGQPVWMTLIQQGHQVTDVMTSTGVGFKQLGSAVLGLLSPTTLIVAGVAAASAALYEMGSSAERAQSQLLTLQNRLRATRTDYVAMAAEVTGAAHGAASPGSGISYADALAAGQTIAGEPNFSGTQQQLQSLIQTADNMALVFNETLPQAAQKLAQAFDDPGAVAEDLATKHFPAMSQALADSINQMENAGDKAGAFNAVLQAIQQGTAGASQNLTPWQHALANLEQAFGGTTSSAKDFSDSIGGTLVTGLAHAVNLIAELTNGVKDLWDEAGKAPAAKQQTYASANGFSGFGEYVSPDLQAATQAAVNAEYKSALSQVQPSIQAAIVQAAQANNIDPDLLARLQLAEGQYNPQTGWATSSTGRIGPMQVAPSLFEGMQAQPSNYPTVVGLTDLTDPTQNVNAGASYFGHLIQKYGNLPDAVLAYHDGEPTVDKFLNGQGEPSTQAFAEATTVLKGYSGSGTFPAANIGVPSQNEFDTTPVFTQANPLDDADKIAASLGLSGKDGSTLQQLNAEALTLNGALQTLGSRTADNAQEWDKLSTALDTVHQRFLDAAPPLQKLIETTDDQTQANEAMAAAWLQGGDAVQQATVLQKAQADLIQAHITPTMASYADALATAIDQESKLAQSAQDTANAQQTAQNDNQLQYIQAETDSLGENNDQRTAMLAALQEEIKLKDQGKDITLQSAQADIQSAGAVAQATATYNDQKQALDSLSQSFSSAFDSIGDAITQAFVQGQGAAVNWKNVMDSVIEQVLQQALKLAVLNPILNDLFGQNNPTLGSAFAALSSAANSGTTTSGTGTSSGFGVGTVLQVGSLANTASGGGLLNALGLGNIGQELGLTGPGGLVSSVSSFLASPLIGGVSMSPTASVAALDAGLPVAPALTVGGALTGVGLGFGAGSLLDSLLGAKNPTLGTIGSAAGGIGGTLAAGALLGSALGPIGGIFGGLLGGARGFIRQEGDNDNDSIRSAA